MLWVKLDPEISAERRDFVSNGIRSYFLDDTNVLLDIEATRQSISGALLYMQFLIVVIAVIALTIAFYLLLVSTTSNIQENVWEYGCLRAVGLSTSKGMRLYMYE